MNNYVSTEKSLKRWLKSRVKITMATVVGFLIAGTVTFGAKEPEIPKDGVYDNDILINKLLSTKFAVGQNGNLEIYSDGSVGLLLLDLQKDHSLSGIMNALNQQNSNPNKVVLTGAIAGQGKYSEGIDKVLEAMKEGEDTSFPNEIEKKFPKIKEIIKRTNTATPEIQGNTKTTVGKIDGKESPVVLGLVGGDFVVGTGKITKADFSKFKGKIPRIILKTEATKTKINRIGDSDVTINNGNIFGGSAGSTAISTGINIDLKDTAEISLNGNANTTINGDTNLNINGGANAAGVTAGGIAAAIGGTATSNVTGDTNIKVNSVVNAGELAGLTVGLFGGGMAVSTLGGTADTNTKGTTNVEITDGLSVGVAGGGLAASSDMSQIIEKTDNFLIKLALIATSERDIGGTSKVTSGDINVALNGTTAAAGVLGNGIAVSHQNAPQGAKPTENDKLSTSTVEAENITVNVDLEKKIDGKYISDNKVIGKVGTLLGELKNIADPKVGTDVGKVINSMQEVVKVLKGRDKDGKETGGGIAVGVLGNGVAVARDKGISTVTANTTTINLNKGYIVGVVGNGIASGNASSTVTAGSSEVNINGAEVIGVTGSGIALDHSVVDDEAYSKATIGSAIVSVSSGSADGIFGGGIAVTKAHEYSKAEVNTETSTINVTGGTVDKFGYQHISGIFKNHGSFDKIAEIGKNVAIVGGGVASRNGVTTVGESIINITGGTVKGDILAGGIAVSGGTSTVNKSTINITGGKIEGSVYGYGLASKEENGGVNIVDKAGTATVGGPSVENPDVKELSVLNIDGYKNSLEKIAGFNEINIGMNKAKSAEIDKYNTQLTITDGIDVGAGKLENAGAIIFNNSTANSTLMTVAEGGSVLNKGLVVVDAGDKVADGEGYVKNTGKIQIADKSLEELKNDGKDFAIGNFFGENYTHIGMIVDKNGEALLLDEENIASGTLTTEDINNATPDGDRNVTLSSAEITSDGTVNLEAVNVVGNVKADANVTFEKTTLNFTESGNVEITDGKSLTVSNTTVNGSEKEADIKFAGEDSRLVLNNSNVKAGVIGENTTNGVVEFTGTENSFDGTIKARNININKGHAVAFGENAVGAGTITLNGDAKIAVGKENTDGVYTQNFFHNSNGNLDVQGTGNIVIGTKNFEGEKVTVDFGENNKFGADLINKLDTTSVYMIKDGEDLKDKKLELVYNTKLYEDNSVLNNINNAAHVVNDKFSDDPEVRKAELDKHYSSNIYSETVKAAYDNVKMNEEAVESLARKSEIGKWTAEGKALYSKNEYDRKGIVGDYSSEIESTGLMAAYGYGLNETTTAGIAFSGVKQDVDTATGSADADLFYLGVYGNKVVGNYDFTAGLGYQFGKYEADNNILAGTGDKYDSQTVSGYVQGRYTADLGDGLSVQPKVKLGYTYVKQDDAKDSYFGVEDAEISTFDAEAGFDVVKSVQLEKSKVDVKFGASYIRTMGDTDEEFTGRFYGAKASEGFNVLGAELAENVVKFNLGAEVTNENGFFYNGGFTYEFGSNDTEAYGFNVGVGYKF